MIGTIDIEINAAHPTMPLAEFAAFVNSPSHVRVRNVPRRVGLWELTKLYVAVTFPDNATRSVEATHNGALWTATVAGCVSSGAVRSGFQVIADGVDESGNSITGYVLGVGDVTILNRDATITVDGVTYYLHLLNSVPETPHIGDVATIDGSLKLYDGSAWVSFAAGASIEIVAPSTNPTDAGKAADAKATGDALAGKLSKTEAEAGFTEWTLAGLPAGATDATLTFLNGEPPSWRLSFTDGGGIPVTSMVTGEEDAVELVFGDITATRTRLPTMADIPAASDATPQMDGTGAPGSSVAFARADHVHPTDTSRASTTDVVLTPVYGGNGQRFSTWTILRDGEDVTEQVQQPTWQAGYWLVQFSIADTDMPGDIDTQASLTADSITWTALTTLDSESVTYTATRTENPVVGYTLGDQSTKPLQPQGTYAPATNIPKSALASGVQTSLGKADTAVQPSALADAVRYDLPANATAISSASSETVEGETVTYGKATLADRTANRVSVTAAIDELRLTFPAAVTGKVRDFGLRVEVGDGPAALTAPALVPVAASGETVTLENSDGEIPALADGTATAKGVTLLYFSETAPGVFLVKGEEAKEVA